MDPENKNISLFLTDKPIEISNNLYYDIHLIAFLYAAFIRESSQDLCYIDLTKEDFDQLKLKLRCNHHSATFLNQNYSKYHYEVYLTEEKKKSLSSLIFNKIGKLPGQKLTKIKKTDLEKIKDYFKSNGTLDKFDKKKFHKWAFQ